MRSIIPLKWSFCWSHSSTTTL